MIKKSYNFYTLDAFRFYLKSHIFYFYFVILILDFRFFDLLGLFWAMLSAFFRFWNWVKSFVVLFGFAGLFFWLTFFVLESVWVVQELFFVWYWSWVVLWVFILALIANFAGILPLRCFGFGEGLDAWLWVFGFFGLVWGDGHVYKFGFGLFVLIVGVRLHFDPIVIWVGIGFGRDSTLIDDQRLGTFLLMFGLRLNFLIANTPVITGLLMFSKPSFILALLNKQKRYFDNVLKSEHWDRHEWGYTCTW